MGKRGTYKVRLIKQGRSYTFKEIAKMLNLHPFTVGRWSKIGLVVMSDNKPHLVHGTELVKFLLQKQERRKKPCQLNEFYCCRCRVGKPPHLGVVSLVQKDGRILLTGECQDCKTKIIKFGVVAQLKEYEKIFQIVSLSEGPPPYIGSSGQK